MGRVIRDLRKVSMRRFGYVEINDDVVLPVHTVGTTTLQNILVDFHKSMKLPKMKPKIANAEMLEELRTMGYEVKAGRHTVTDLDKTSDEFMDYLKDYERLEKFMNIAVHIDLNYNKESDVELWELCGLENDKDLLGLCELLINLDMKDEYIRAISMTISSIQNSSFRSYEQYEKALEEELKAKKEEE